MRPPSDDVCGEVERETRRSRYRDRCSRMRLHPIQHDIAQLVDFVMERRRRQRDGLAAARCVLETVNTDALRTLIHLAREHGRCNRTMRRRCERIENYCLIIETALALRAACLQVQTEEEP